MTLNVRCSARFDSAPSGAAGPGSAASADAPRTALNRGGCQLYVGHEAEHALLALDATGRRILRRWGGDLRSDLPFAEAIPAQLPWAPSMPQVEVGSLRARPATLASAPRGQANRPGLRSVA